MPKATKSPDETRGPFQKSSVNPATEIIGTPCGTASRPGGSDSGCYTDTNGRVFTLSVSGHPVEASPV